MSTKRTKGPAASNMEEWRLEAVLVSLLELSDSQGRLLCPPFRILESRQVIFSTICLNFFVCSLCMCETFFKKFILFFRNFRNIMKK